MADTEKEGNLPHAVLSGVGSLKERRGGGARELLLLQLPALLPSPFPSRPLLSAALVQTVRDACASPGRGTALSPFTGVAPQECGTFRTRAGQRLWLGSRTSGKVPTASLKGLDLPSVLLLTQAPGAGLELCLLSAQMIQTWFAV